MGIITSGDFPAFKAGRESACISCGHCVAVCPTGAISVGSITPATSLEIKPDLTASIEEAEQIIRSRRSIRVYKNNFVPEEKIKKLIDIACHAPTASNSQLISWSVINSPEKVHEIARLVIEFFRTQMREGNSDNGRYRFEGLIAAWDGGHDMILRSAPALIIAHAPESHRFAAVDGSIALTCFDIAAPSLGLGACWAGFFMAAASLSPEIRKAVGIPEGNLCAGALMLGEPKFSYYRCPPRKQTNINWQ